MISTYSEQVPLHYFSRGPLWFAVRTKLRGETLAAAALQRKGWECLVPSQAAGSDLPADEQLVFDGLVFCRFDWRHRLGVLAAPGVVEIVGRGAALEEAEWKALHRLADGGWQVRPWPYTAEGPRAQILAGPLAGLEGIWANSGSGGQLIFSLHSVRRSAAVEIDQQCIQVAA